MIFLKLIRKALCFFVLLCSTQIFAVESTTSSVVTQPSLDLLVLMQKRLDLMHEVARVKWNRNLPVEDIVREQEILTGLVGLGLKEGLDEKWTTRFFQAQFEAAKEVQRNDFTLWTRDGVLEFENVLSLQDLRLQIDQINQEIISLLGDICIEDRENF